MDLLREWRRRTVGGAMAAVLAPAAIVGAALAVGVFGGGIRGLGSLNQTLTGPTIPTVEPATARTTEPDEEAGRLIERAAETRARADARDRTAPRRRTRTRRRRDDDRPSSDGDRPAAPRPPATSPSPPPTTEPPPPPPPPSTIRQVGDRVKEVTNDVPVAGEPAGQVIDLVVETVESLPIPPQPLPTSPPLGVGR